MAQNQQQTTPDKEANALPLDTGTTADPASDNKLTTPDKGSSQLSFEPEAYRCKTVCYWRGKLYHVGDKILVPSGTKIPVHFERVK